MNNENGVAPKAGMPGWYWVVAVLVVAGVGWYVWSLVQPVQQRNATSLNPTQAVPEQNVASSTIQPVDTILLAAQPSFQAATLLGVELETEDGVQVYKLTLSDGRILRFNAMSGVSLGAKQDALETDVAARTAIPSGLTFISFDAARAAAAAKRPSIAIKKVELEIEEGVPVYTVEFVDQGKVDVNAVTGEVTRVKEPGKDEVKTNNDDFDKDGTPNETDTDVDNDGTPNSEDTDNDDDKIEDVKDQNDDNDGVKDSEDSDHSGSDSSDSGSGSSGSGKKN